MDVETIPAMKPVLVTTVSDDIGVLQKDDVEKQCTVLTARAIEDIYKCAPIVESNPTDAQFFTAEHKVDLDRIVEACSRTLGADQYVNGPRIFRNSVPNGGSEWAVDNTPVDAVLHASLYVYSVLDNGQLSWQNYDGRTSMRDWDGTDRRVDERVKSPIIRQVLVPNDYNEYLKFDGVRGLDSHHRTRYNFGVPWVRDGKVKFSGSADSSLVDGKVYYKKVGDKFQRVYNPSPDANPMQELWYEYQGYEWEPWYMMSKVHNGPEYFSNINIFDEVKTQIQDPLTDAIYHIYDNVANFILPNANKDGYKVGQKLIIEVHPPIVKTKTSSCRVTYQDTGARGERVAEESMQVLITPKVRRNTKDVYGNVRDDVLVTSVAVFEIVETNDGTNSYRTWELDAGVEETDFTSGLAQQLGEHTDPCTGDLVQYQRPSISGETTLQICVPLTQSGYVVGRFLKNDPARALADNTWQTQIQVISLNSEACFNKVNTKGNIPDPAKIYFIKEGVTFHLTENSGHPTSFDEREFYTIDMTHGVTKDVIQVMREGEVLPSPYLKLSDLEWDTMRRFTAFAHRNDLLVITVSASSPISGFQGKILPEVLFYPDPHNSYIQKAAMNPSAYTYLQLEKLFKDGAVIDDITLSVGTEVLEGIMNSPASSRALMEGYAYMAHKLQERGRLLGNVRLSDVIGTGLDSVVDPGFYYVEPRTPITSANTFPPHMDNEGCNLVVIGNEKAPAGIVHEEEGGIDEQNKVMQVAFFMNKEEPDPLHPGETILFPMFVETRVGTKQPDGTWKWSAWRDWLDWNDIRNKPIFFHARWDYFEDPDGFLNHVDNDNVVILHNRTENACEVVHKITMAEIAALMEESSDPEYDVVVNYNVPQFLVGLKTLAPTKWASAKESGESIHYVTEVQLPPATRSQISDETKTRRRKIRFVFYGQPGNNGWDKSVFRLSYNSSVSGRASYTYERNWGGEAESALDLVFEQVDLPNGDRAWCPIVIG